MKLLVGLVASALAIECPNDVWELNGDSSKCVPKENTVSITCDATEMIVTFEQRHLYVNMGVDHVDSANSAAGVGNCATEISTDGGKYELKIPLDGCDTQVAQGADVITFTNTITGSDLALEIDGIITTEKLELDVQCDYTSTLSVAVGDIGIEAAGHALGDSLETGDVSVFV